LRREKGNFESLRAHWAAQGASVHARQAGGGTPGCLEAMGARAGTTDTDDLPVEMSRKQREMMLAESAPRYAAEARRR
jgi:hypothetical protein